MVKGLRKNMIVVKCERDSPFESAFFILKDNGELGARGEEDIMSEACAIIDAASGGKLKKPKKKRGLSH